MSSPMTGSVTRRATTRAPFPRQYPLAARPTTQLTRATTQWARRRSHLAKPASDAATLARSAVLEERQRLAREIHDSLGQAFTAILLQLQSAEAALGAAPDRARAAIGHVRALARDGLADTRRAVDALHPQTLDRFDLATALRRTVAQATLGLPIGVTCSVSGDSYPVPTDTAVQLLRIAQETLSNTLKYAHARHLTVDLLFGPQHTQLRVQDDGCGFDPTSAAAAGGVGLLSVRARAATIGAELTLSSAPGEGTILSVVLPRNQGGSDER